MLAFDGVPLMRRIFQMAVGGLAAFVLCASLVLAGGGVALGATHAAVGEKARERAARALREGEFEVAENLYREMIEKNPRDVEARLGLSYALLKQRKNQAAYDAAARVIAIDAMSARAHALLGAALLNSGDFRLSVEEFRTALGFKQDEALAVAGLAMVDFYESRVSQSLAQLRRAVFLDGDEPDYIFNLAQVAARAERYTEAADAYERFLRIAPKTDADRRARIRGLIDFLRYLGTQRNLLRAEGAARTVVPFQLVNNRPVVRVRINNSKEPLRFVIDTGAGMCVISSRAAERLGLKPVARGGYARGIGGVGKFEIVYGFLSAVQLGEARVEDVPVYIRQFFNEGEDLDGYIGLSVVSKYLFSLDYGTGEMTLARGEERSSAVPVAVVPTGPTPTAAPAGIEFPIRTTSSGFWSGEVQIEGVSKPANFIVDTGATITVVSSAMAEREEMTRFAQTSRLTVYGAAGLAENVQMLLLPRLHIANETHQNVAAAVLDMDPINETSGFEQAGILGGNVLRHYRLTFDLGRAVVRFEPLARKVPEEERSAPPVVANQP